MSRTYRNLGPPTQRANRTELLGSAEDRAQIEGYVAELRRRTEDYGLPAAEARRVVDGAMGETKLTNILYRISRAEPLAWFARLERRKP
jgi:hypothetical protein